jgi:prepilin signal peptidase PulO-like enzyme (type II secretory pathway)
MPAIAAPLFALGFLIGRQVGSLALPAARPVVALGLGTLYAATGLILSDEGAGDLALALSLCTVLSAITLTDLERRTIPNRTVATGAVGAIAITAAVDAASIGARALAALAAGGTLFAVSLARPKGLGMGDVKLVAMIGLYLGPATAPAVLIALGLGAVAGIALIARHGAKARKRAIAFGPFLAVGGVLGLWFGDGLVDWYLEGVLHNEPP